MSATYPTNVREHVAESISHLWWLILLRGVLLLFLGAYALARPAMSLAAFTQVLGAFALVDGVFAVMAGVLGWTESRGWTIVRGLLGILVGLFVLGHPLVVGAIAATIVVCIIAFQAIVGGLLEIIVAIRERKQLEGEGWLILGGILSLIFGAILLMAPFASSLLLIRILGAYAIVFGVVMIVNAFRLRGLGKTVRSA